MRAISGQEVLNFRHSTRRVRSASVIPSAIVNRPFRAVSNVDQDQTILAEIAETLSARQHARSERKKNVRRETEAVGLK